MNKIVVIGSSNTDMMILSEHLPVQGQIIIGGQFTMNPGGKGANQSIAIARMGGNVTFITKTGNDLFGKQSLELYKSEGIMSDYVFSDPEEPSGVGLILVDSYGEKYISIAQGAIKGLSIEDIEKARTEIESASVIMMELEIPMETAKYIAEIAVSKEIPVILNPSPIQFISDELLKKVKIIIPNKTEAELLTGVLINDEESARKAALNIHEKGIETVIITLGSKGALIFHENKYYKIPAEKITPIDATAAGDTFCGTFCVGLTEGLSIVDAVKIANKAAAISTTRKGGQASIPYRNEVLS